MSNYVLKYRRGDEVKYISHLDFVRMFHRAVRRAGLLMEYSQGFNPHPIMTVAMPLSVGVTSNGEYMKIGFSKNYSEDEIKASLNSALPKGFEILAVKRVEGKELDFSKLDRAEYIIEAELENPFVPDLEEFLKKEKILVMKKSKSGIKQADIKPYIYKLKLTEKNGNFIKIEANLASGNLYNLKPETVLDAISVYYPEFRVEAISVQREKILAQDTEYLA